MVDTWNTAVLNEAVANGSIGGGGEGSTTLSGLTDVNLTTPTGGDLLSYDGESSKWVNTAPTAPDAEDISYNNTDSGLTATDVQSAIDELVSTDLLKSKPLSTTTTSVGNVVLSDPDISDSNIVSVVSHTANSMGLIAHSEGGDLMIRFINPSTLTGIASTAVTATIYYL